MLFVKFWETYGKSRVQFWRTHALKFVNKEERKKKKQVILYFDCNCSKKGLLLFCLYYILAHIAHVYAQHSVLQHYIINNNKNNNKNNDNNTITTTTINISCFVSSSRRCRAIPHMPAAMAPNHNQKFSHKETVIRRMRFFSAVFIIILGKVILQS